MCVCVCGNSNPIRVCVVTLTLYVCVVTNPIRVCGNSNPIRVCGNSTPIRVFGYSNPICVCGKSTLGREMETLHHQAHPLPAYEATDCVREPKEWRESGQHLTDIRGTLGQGGGWDE